MADIEKWKDPWIPLFEAGVKCDCPAIAEFFSTAWDPTFRFYREADQKVVDAVEAGIRESFAEFGYPTADQSPGDQVPAFLTSDVQREIRRVRVGGYIGGAMDFATDLENRCKCGDTVEEQKRPILADRAVLGHAIFSEHMVTRHIPIHLVNTEWVKREFIASAQGASL